MELTQTQIPDVILVSPKRFGDKRGYFSETYNEKAFAEIGIKANFIQDNYCYSTEVGTLRGLHFQKPPATQTKLLRVLRGAIVDVCVDLRHGSPTFGQHVMVELTAESGQQILCPQGFAHGFLTLQPNTEVTYKVDSYYAPMLDSGVRFDDPDLAIDWPIAEANITLSDKDHRQQWFRDLPAIFSYQPRPERPYINVDDVVTAPAGSLASSR